LFKRLNYFFLDFACISGFSRYRRIFPGKEKDINDLDNAERIDEKNNHKPRDTTVSSRSPKRYSLPWQAPEDYDDNKPGMGDEVVEKSRLLHR
jgi:hypothetical protein